MLPLKTMLPLKDSKKTSAAASKIKNKILNTSSFFKVSLKMNNKALALALEAQKERSRQLEREVVSLQKQVEALCFELATRKYKDRKLVLILKNLYSDTLQHFDAVTDLFSDSDPSKPFNDRRSLFGDNMKGNAAQSRLTEQLPAEPEVSVDLLWPSKNRTADIPPQTINDFSIPSGPIMTTDVEEGPSNQQTEAPLAAAPRPSSSLRDKVERLSMIYSRFGFDVTAATTKPPPSLTDDLSPPPDVEREPKQDNVQEKTMLLNTAMEMTLSNAAEIVTVETEVKKTARSGKPKRKKNKEEASQPSGKNSAESLKRKVQSDSSDSALHTDDHALENIIDPEVIQAPSPKTLCKDVITSRIPKLSKAQPDYGQKTGKNKSCDQPTSNTESCDVLFPDRDPYFTDPDLKWLPEKHTADEAVSKITCRRSRTRGKKMSSASRKTFDTLPPSRESESTQFSSEQLHDEEEGVVKDGNEARKDLPEKLQFSADEVESEYARQTSSSSSNMVDSGGSHSSRCRGTFVISVATDRTTSNSVSPEMVQHFTPGAGADCVSEEPSAVTDVRQDSETNPQRHSERAFAGDALSSCKRRWVATQDSESFQDLSRNENLYQDCSSDTEFHKTKKPRKEETRQSSKKKIMHRGEEGRGDALDNKTKRNTRSKGCRSKEKSHWVQELSDVSSTCGIGQDNKEHSEDSQVVGSDPYISGNDDIFQHLYDSKPTKSKSRMDLNPKQRRKKSNLHTPTESRNPRETFIVYRRKTQDSDSLNGTRTPHVLDARSDEALHHNVGDLLTDELPPWLALDVSAADTEALSLLASPTGGTLGAAAVTEDPVAVTAEASPGRVLTSLTNTIATSDSENGGRTRRRNGVVSYKEPPLNSKMRRGDKFTDSMFLSSPVFKDGKKKKRQKKNVQEDPLDTSLFMD